MNKTGRIVAIAIYFVGISGILFVLGALRSYPFLFIPMLGYVLIAYWSIPRLVKWVNAVPTVGKETE